MEKRKAVRTKRAPGAIGPYSQGIAAGGLLFVSGQIPIDPDSAIHRFVAQTARERVVSRAADQAVARCPANE